MIRVFIVHHSQVVSSVMAQSLLREREIRIVNQVTSAEEALVRIGNDNCNVVLAAAGLPNNGAVSLIRKLKSANANVRVVVTGAPGDKHEIMRFMLAGAAGYTLEEDGAAKLVETVRAAHEGKALISPEVAAMLMEHIAKLSTITAQTTPNATAHADLTARESDVLMLMAEGCSNKAIAERLIISTGTVKNHVHNVLKKLNLRSRKDAALYVTHVQGNNGAMRSRYARNVA